MFTPETLPRNLTLPLLASKPFESLYGWQWLPRPPDALRLQEEAAAAAAHAVAAVVSPPSSSEVVVHSARYAAHNHLLNQRASTPRFRAMFSSRRLSCLPLREPPQ